jgi:Flp pilus assembly protein TadG
MKRPRARRRKGTAAAELAVCLIPLMTIVMGIIECGRLMMVEEVTINASREGARLASLSGATIGSMSSTGSTEVDYRVLSYLTAAGVPTSSVTITVTDLDQPSLTDLTQANPGDRIQVQASMPFTSVALCTPWFFGHATITGTSTMMKEAP